MFVVENLNFRYPKNNNYTLQDLQLQINPGEIFGLLGPSGVGKSTTQKILIKLLSGYEGKVLYRGKDLQAYGREYFNEIGVGFEIPVHFSKLTAKENLEFLSRLYSFTTSPDELLKRVGLYDDRNRQVNEFSKGMKVRLNFVRALLNSPKFLFLDEPTNGLDPMNARVLKDMILEFKENRGTVFLTTHLMSDVDELCDRVAFLAHGRIVETNSPKNLKLKYGERRVSVEYMVGEEMKEASFDLDSLGQNARFLEIVQNRRIITIHSKETTLEDIFIKLTGVEAHG